MGGPWSSLSRFQSFKARFQSFKVSKVSKFNALKTNNGMAKKNKTKLLDKIFGIQKYVCTSTSEGVDDTVWIHNRSVTVNKVVEI